MEITFTNVSKVSEMYAPVPASKEIPEWYRNLESYMANDKRPTTGGLTTATMKRCMPVFDAMVSGYIIPTYVDVFVSQVEQPKGDTLVKAPFYSWPSFSPIEFHPIEQAPQHPNRNGHQISYPKWSNPWAIKTPPGYSTLFLPPMHRESVFTVFPGVVDTDQYLAPVNFPFVLNDVTFEGLIPAGTPMVQVIPFKRDEWQMSIGNEKEQNEQEKVLLKLRSRFFDAYKSLFRQTKEYR